MKLKNAIAWPLIASVALFAIGYFLTSSYQYGFCSSDPINQIYDVSCHNILERIGNPLFYGMGAVSTVLLVLLAVPSAFGAWKKFAMWAVPLVALLFAFYPSPGSGDYFSPYPETVFKWVSAAFVVVSLAIISFTKMRKPRA